MSGSSSAADKLPAELWALIFRSAPLSDRLNAALVNRYFYNIVIVDLYHHVKVTNTISFNQAFQTLWNKRDLAEHVSKLTLCDAVLSEHFPGGDSSEHGLRPSEIQAAFPELFHGQPRFRTTATESPLCTLSSPSSKAVNHRRDIHMLFKAVLSRLKNVRRLILVSLDPDGTLPTSPISSELLSSIWASIGANLHALTLNMPMYKLGEMMQMPSHELSALDELHISLNPQHNHELAEDCERALADVVVPFINQLAPQLREFSFSSICIVFNLDPLFEGMGPTPRLRVLSLCFGEELSQKWSLGALEAFLMRHEAEETSVKYEECYCLHDFHWPKCNIQ